MSDPGTPADASTATPGSGTAGKAVTDASEAAGAAKAVAEAEKYRSHKDNPTQPPVGPSA